MRKKIRNEAQRIVAVEPALKLSTIVDHGHDVAVGCASWQVARTRPDTVRAAHVARAAARSAGIDLQSQCPLVAFRRPAVNQQANQALSICRDCCEDIGIDLMGSRKGF